MSPLDGRVTTKVAAKMIGRAPCSIRRFYLDGKLPNTIKEGRDLFIDPADLAKLKLRPPGRPRNDEPLDDAA